MDRRSDVKFGIFYEHQLPRPWTTTPSTADPGRARADRARRHARHRLRVGGRAPLPRGVLPLERARGVPRRGVAAHEAHPARPRHRADAAAVQPSGPHRRAHRDARPRVERARRLRHRRVVVGGRARRVHDRPRREARDVGGGPARRGAVHDRDAVHRSLRRVRHDAAAQRRARSRCQKPHPPVWVACSRRDTIHLAAQKGIGALAFAFVDPEEAQHWVDDYYDDARRPRACRSATR